MPSFFDFFTEAPCQKTKPAAHGKTRQCRNQPAMRDDQLTLGERIYHFLEERYGLEYAAEYATVKYPRSQGSISVYERPEQCSWFSGPRHIACVECIISIVSQFLFYSHSIPQGSGPWAGVSRPCGSSRPTKSCRKAMRRTVRTYVEDVGATIRRKQRFNKKPWRTRFASGICWLETLGPAAPRPSHRLDDLAEAPGSGLGLLLLAAPSGTCTRMPEVPGRVGALGALR